MSKVSNRRSVVVGKLLILCLFGVVGFLANLTTLEVWVSRSNRSEELGKEERGSQVIQSDVEKGGEEKRRPDAERAEEAPRIAVGPQAGVPGPSPITLPPDDLKQLVRESSREGAREVVAVVQRELQQLKDELEKHKRETSPRLDAVELALKKIQERLSEQGYSSLDPEKLKALVRKVILESHTREIPQQKNHPPARPAPKLFTKPPPPARVTPAANPTKSGRMTQGRASAP